MRVERVIQEIRLHAGQWRRYGKMKPGAAQFGIPTQVAQVGTAASGRRLGAKEEGKEGKKDSYATAC